MIKKIAVGSFVLACLLALIIAQRALVHFDYAWRDTSQGRDVPVEVWGTFATLAKDRKASNHIVVQVYTNDQLIREFTFVEAVVGTYIPLGFNETESVFFETSAEPTVICGAPVLG